MQLRTIKLTTVAGIDGYKELLSLKEKDEMLKIAAAQRRPKKRRKKPKRANKKDAKQKKISLDDFWAATIPSSDEVRLFVLYQVSHRCV